MHPRHSLLTTAAALLLTLALAVPPAPARNVDLSTVPRRDTVQLTIYNSEDLTLVRETRTLTFKKGINGLQFSWANTLIDPSSVELRFLTKADKLDLLDTTFPHDKPQMLYWNVVSDFDGDAQVEITYFTSGITWSADYVLSLDAAEEKAALQGWVAGPGREDLEAWGALAVAPGLGRASRSEAASMLTVLDGRLGA